MKFFRTPEGHELIKKGVKHAGMNNCWNETFQAEAIKATDLKISETFSPEQRQFVQSKEDSDSSDDESELQGTILYFF
jgi:hypothetical protein